MFLIRLSILAALVVPACTIPNETHCGNLRGDETCAERYGEAMYCDVCVSANDGCVQSVPDAACRFEEHGTGSGNATTSPGSTDPTSSPSTSVGSASASGGTTSEDPTTPLTVSDSDATTDTSSDDGSTATAMDTESEGTTGDASTGDATEGTTASTTDDPTMTSADPTTDPTETETGACMGLGSECDGPEDCCIGLCLPDVLLGIDVCV